MSKKNTTTQVQINFTYAGIDVSKRWLDLCAPGLSGRFENSKAGLAKLVRALLRSCRGGLPPLAVLEASGGYERPCLDALEEAGIAFRLLNPRRARDFANASGRLAKTDAIDAATLAELGASLRLEPRAQARPEVREIAGLEARRDAVLGDIHAEGCRLEKTVDPWVAKRIKAHLRSLEKELAAIDARIAERIAAGPLLAAKNATMQCVCGVGPRVSASLLANVPELGSPGRKASASPAGLAPFNRDSGQFRGQRTCNGGARTHAGHSTWLHWLPPATTPTSSPSTSIFSTPGNQKNSRSSPSQESLSYTSTRSSNPFQILFPKDSC